MQKISNALISVFNKQGLEPIVKTLNQNGVTIFSTGGTQKFIEELDIPVIAIEKLTGFPEILGGRVKTLHPIVFGAILARRENESDLNELQTFNIPLFDLVIVDLYPFEETLKLTDNENEIIEKIDIGGVSLIRATAKNFKHTLIISNTADYNIAHEIFVNQQCASTIEQRKLFSLKAFNTTSHYDTVIFNWFNQTKSINAFKQSINTGIALRYGENPHQKGFFYGNLHEYLIQLNGKELSYNNLLDIDSAVALVEDFNETVVCIVKHNNACGVAARNNVLEAWKDALAADPTSAFGGVICLNQRVEKNLAEEIDKIFFEVIIAPDFSGDALDVLKTKKNRIIIKKIKNINSNLQVKTALNGYLVQDKNAITVNAENLKAVTQKIATQTQIEDLLFADKIVKHTKSNAIVLVKNKQLIGIGCGQTSRVDALKQAIAKAKSFNFNLQNAVMSSDAFFPFPDCVEIAFNEGIDAVIQPGGSIKDVESINFCNAHNMSMYFTGIRHFKH